MLCIKCKKEIEEDSTFCRFCGKKQKKDEKKPMRRPNGTGTVRNLGGRRKRPWAAIVSKMVDNKQKQVYVGFYQTKTEALEALALTAITPVSEGHNLTVGDIYNMWSKKHYGKINDSTVTTYKSAWLYLEPYAKLKMRSFTTQHIQSAIDTAEARGKGFSTCKNIKIVASQICKQAMKDDIINKDYAQFVVLPEHKQKEKQIFTPDEIKLLWQYKNEKTAQIILVLIYTGMRVNELFTLQNEDVNLEFRYLKGGSKTDAGKDRIIPIHKDILPFIKEWMKSEGYLLTNQNGKKLDVPNFRDRNFYPFLEEIGILEKGKSPRRLTPHSTRHTFISRMVKNNSKPEFLQRIVGHEQYETTIDFYTHISDEDVHKLVAEVDEHFSL